MTDTTTNEAEPAPNPLGRAVFAYTTAVVASNTDGLKLQFNAIEVLGDVAIAMRLSEFLAEKLAPLMHVTSEQLQADFAGYLDQHTAKLRENTSRLAIARPRPQRG